MMSRAESPARKQYFLPTHLSLLRALHADDETTGVNATESFPRPSWLEINNFVRLQASMLKRHSQSRRTHGVLEALGGQAAVAPVSPPSYAVGPPTRAGQLQRGPDANEATVRHRGPTRVDQAGGVASSGAVNHEPSRNVAGSRETLPASALDPRSVVCAVLRRAVRDHEDEHRAACAGMRVLKGDVDVTVEQLAYSLQTLMRSRMDRAAPWRGREEDGAHAADVLERHTNKLVLWRRLQAALSACHIVGDGAGGGVAQEREPSSGRVRQQAH